MANNNKEVRARISVDTRDYQKGMEQASKVTEKESNKINRAVEEQGSTSESTSNRVIQNNTKITGSYTKLKTATVEGINKIKNVITSMGSTNNNVTQNISNDSNKIVKAFTGIKTATGNSVEAIKTGYGKMTQSFTGLVNNVKTGANKIKDSFKGVNNTTQTSAGVWGNNLQDMVREYERLTRSIRQSNGLINNSTNQSTNVIRRSYDKLKTTIRQFGDKVKTTTTQIISSTGRLNTSIRNMATNQNRSIGSLTTVYNTLSSRVRSAFTGITSATSSTTTTVRQQFSRMTTAVRDFSTDVKDSVNRIKTSFTGIVSSVRTTAQNYRQSFNNMMQNNKDFMQSQKDVADKVAEAGKKITATATGIATAYGTAGYLAYSKAEDSTSKIQATLRLTKEEAEDLRETAKKLSYEGFDFEESLNGMLEVKKNLSDVLDEKQFESFTRGAMYLQDVFGVDVKDTVKSTGAMMRNFGIDGAEALDIITYGLQNGLDMSGDFLDTLWEYAPQMKKLGFTAEETLQVINTGMKEGAFNTDKLLDGVKEFRLRLSEIDDTGAGALEKLGFKVEDVEKAINGGGEGAKKMAMKVSLAISKVKSDVERNALSVALFGTQFEDVGDAIYKGLNNAKEPIDDLITSAESLQEAYEDNIERKMTGSINKLKDSFAGVGEAIAPVLVKVMDALSEFLNWFSSLPTEVHQGIFILLGIVAVFGALITVIASVIGAVFAVGIAIATFELWGPIVGIVLALTGAIMGLCSIDWGEFTKGAKEVFTFLIAFVEGIHKTMVTTTEVVWTMMGESLKMFKDIFEQGWNLICEIFEKKGDILKEIGQGILTFLVDAFSNQFEAIKEDLRLSFEFIKALFSGDLDKCKEIVGDKFDNMVNLIKNNFKDAFKSVKDTIDRIKKLFDFEWKFPDIKTPKFSWSGNFDLLAGTVPKLDVKWHAKGGIYTKPTLFNTGDGIHGVGEAGAEAILPLDKLPSLLGLDKKGNGDMIFNFHDTQINGYQDVEQLSKELAVLVRRRTV